jgi:hypothetical protein
MPLCEKLGNSQAAPLDVRENRPPAAIRASVDSCLFGVRFILGLKKGRSEPLKSPKTGGAWELQSSAKAQLSCRIIVGRRLYARTSYRCGLVGQWSRRTANKNAVDRPNSSMPFSASIAPSIATASPGTRWRDHRPSLR